MTTFERWEPEKKDLRHLSKLQFAVSSNSISVLDEFNLKREQCNMK